MVVNSLQDRDEEIDPGGDQGSGDQGSGDQGSGDQGSGDQGSGETVGPTCASLPEHGMHQLDPRWIQLQRWIHAITMIVIGIVVFTLGIVLMISLPGAWKSLVPTAWILTLALAVVVVVYWPRWAYEHWSYSLGENTMQVRFGVVSQTTVAIPYARVQHVDLHRGPLERNLGLASIRIHNAGTRDAVHTVPGLELAVAEDLRDRLIDAANRGRHEKPVA